MEDASVNSPNHDRVVAALVAPNADGTAELVAVGFVTPQDRFAA